MKLKNKTFFPIYKIGIVPSRIFQEELNVVFPIEVHLQVKPADSFVCGEVPDGEDQPVGGVVDSVVHQNVTERNPQVFPLLLTVREGVIKKVCVRFQNLRDIELGEIVDI